MRRVLVVLVLVIAFSIGLIAGFGVPETRANNPCYLDCFDGVQYICCELTGCVPTGPCR